MIFCITFPVRHPLGDNWIEIEANGQRQAREWTDSRFKVWGSIYDKAHFEQTYFEGGKIGKTIKVG